MLPSSSSFMLSRYCSVTLTVGLSVHDHETTTRTSSTGGSDAIFALVSMIGGFHLCVFCIILRICCFIISFAYCHCVSALAEVNMDCIIHVNMHYPAAGQEAGKHIMETLCFCFCCICVFSSGAVVVNGELLCHSFHHLILLLYLFHLLCPSRTALQ